MTIRAWALSVVAVVFGWVCLQLGVMYFTDVAPGAMAVFANEAFLARLPANMAISDIGDFWVTVASDEPALAKTLYAAGAVIVLPAGLPGCFPLS